MKMDWSAEGVSERRARYYAATQRKFVPFAEPMIFKRGRGQYLWDERDNKYIDLLGMNVCISVGHSHPTVVEAAAAQARELTHCTTMFYHPTPAHLAEELCATMPGAADGSVDWVAHFTNSGGEAVDLALMMARVFTGDTDIVALQNAYHGPTMGAQSVTGIAGFRQRAAQPPGVAFTPEPNQYRGQFGPGAAPYLDALEQTIGAATCGQLAGMIIEPVQGYGGVIEAPAEYVSGAAERVRAAGGVMILDEVQSGVGRMGDHFWAFEASGVIPEIVVMAKGVGNGFPLGAVVAQRHVAESMADKFLFHTYGSNPTSCAAGRAVLQVIEREQLQQNASAVGAALRERLLDLQQKHACIGDVRGRGLLLALEIVSDRAAKTPDLARTAAVFEASRHERVILSKSGPHRSVLRMAPPLCLSLADVDQVAESLDRCFRAVDA